MSNRTDKQLAIVRDELTRLEVFINDDMAAMAAMAAMPERKAHSEALMQFWGWLHGKLRDNTIHNMSATTFAEIAMDKLADFTDKAKVRNDVK